MAQSEKELNLNVTPIDGEQKVVIRHDEPIRIYDPTIVELEGTITAPSEFYMKRQEECVTNECHVTFSKKKTEIKLVVREKDHFKTTVIGKLIRSPFLKGLQINSNSGYSIQGLREALKRARIHFADKPAHKALMVKLMNFTAKVETVVSEHNDREGAKGITVDGKIKSAFEPNALDFVLSVPIFEGGRKIDIPITIEMEPKGGQVELFLVYDELEEVIEKEIDEIFADQAEIFKDIVIIQKD